MSAIQLPLCGVFYKKIEYRGIKLIIEYFDENRIAVINPDMIQDKIINFPETVISVFSHQLFDKLLDYFDDKQKLACIKDVDGYWYVYEVTYKGERYAFCKARLGAPACVGHFEEIISMGAKRIILFGNCGVLDSGIEDCGIIIPTRAIRDEGTSYKYIPAADFIEVNKRYVGKFKALCEELNYKYHEGTVWTTDGIYRETPAKITKMKELGAICVDMECSAVQALCDFRAVAFFQFFYAGDNLDNTVWDARSLSGTARLDDKSKIGLLAFEFAARVK